MTPEEKSKRALDKLRETKAERGISVGKDKLLAALYREHGARS